MKMYHQLFAPVENVPAHSYFAGGNSAEGYRCVSAGLFHEPDFEKLYILKGGPGTGKSTLMTRVAADAEAAGLSVCRYFCGSDPDSLDGIVICGAGRKIGVIDGTAPHLQDPVIPGISGEYVNLGTYWNSALLETRREEAIALTARKTAGFAAATRCLKAADLMDASLAAGAEALLLPEKMHAAIRRLLERFPSGRSAPVSTRILTHAVTMKGAVFFPTTCRSARCRVLVLESGDTARFFLRSLRDAALQRGISVETAVSPLRHELPLALRFPDHNTAFTVADHREEGNELFVNMTRFIDRDARRQIREEERTCIKRRAELFHAAENALRGAAAPHFALESLYGAAMDFAGIGELTEQLSRNILYRLRSR